MKNLDALLELALKAGKEASKVLLEYKDKNTLWLKDDDSPVGLADIKSNEAISEILTSSDIAICSEENILSYEERKNLEYFWLIDPLDGTKSYAKKDKEYCVLIALIHKNTPMLSLIGDVENNAYYYAHAHTKVYKNNEILNLSLEQYEKVKNIALYSKNHDNNEDFFIQNKLEGIKVSSALKFVYLLEAKAGIYPRFGGPKAWDIAAGDFLVKQNGGIMQDFDKKALNYNSPDFKLPSFIAFAKDKFKLKGF
ncbi:TPA: 3'(2'),5'-bisphosphate nucleotidase CysQ [Campylobacter lari]|uniref:3'(2'),5-bisphosphonucleoside 3'(2')-phosphohydrolase n=1 Tax=Campylobacter lari TaxID=201 RepID=A0A825SFE5_CAMLA|nr:3'(2'),5'-bisphosphate nucleotidase CysQ [Campylobacter lari]EAH6262488.1 3'(2'),5'-bisphosphate nucleotidase CysQ [Campylobacter lari]EAI1583222.1 3'(2'),5'-bisphosphate nucleotidase CysQ [Campylobacter lari]EAK0432919.1 3'(2'),5'-bisphosphate nucleotidase CysQ [Campylobacter lari]EAK0451258.1 3'(2'),5'-bisphosphate nucleotidase CysQ [Campylobacter lari]EAK0956986.1 3'(2'),5'-bisphosphate nucleotidase CysQ [Campylobacter lari]